MHDQDALMRKLLNDGDRRHAWRNLIVLELGFLFVLFACLVILLLIAWQYGAGIKGLREPAIVIWMGAVAGAFFHRAKVLRDELRDRQQ